MSQQYIHYVPRKIVTRFPRVPNNRWYSEALNTAEGFYGPKYHVSRRQTGPTRAIKPGDTIWLVAQIHSPWGALPPGIDARIDVDRIEQRADGALRFIASKTSTWFPLTDATAVLAELQTVDATGAVSLVQSHSELPVGQSFQSIRRLSSASVLEDFSKTVALKPVNFISYRIRDGTSLAFRWVRELLQREEVVFWDRWCLPRRLAERRELVDDKALDAYLIEKLRQSEVVWGIESKKYAEEDSYSAKERVEAIRLKKYRSVGADNLNLPRQPIG